MVGRRTSPFNGQRVFLRDGQAAPRNFRVSSQISGVWTNNALVPKPKFLFFVEFLTPGTDVIGNGIAARDTRRFSDTRDGIVFQVKTIDKPKFNFRNETLHQYNKKRVVQTKVDYQPVSITFHDDVGDRVLRFWSEYFEFYYGDNRHQRPGDWREDKVSNEFDEGNGQGWGYIGRFLNQGGVSLLERSNNMHFLETINLYEFYGRQFTKISLIHPKVTSFDHDASDYADGGTGQSITMSFDYEGVIYDLTRQSLSEADVEKFGFLEEFGEIDDSTPNEIPSAISSGVEQVFNPFSGVSEPFDQGLDTGIDRLRNQIIADVVGTEFSGVSTLGGSGVSFGSGSFSALTNRSVVDLFLLSSTTAGSPSTDLIEKQTGVRNAIDNFGETRQVLNPITQVQTAPNKGIDSTEVSSAASVLTTTVNNAEVEISPGVTQLADRSALTNFSRSLGTAAVIAQNEGIISSVANPVDSPTSNVANSDTFVDKFENGTFLLTDRGSAVANAVRSPNSFLGSRRDNITFTTDDAIVDPTRKALDAERDREGF